MANERLDSWKAIARYLGRDRTTVMRWERTAGLPVRRVQGGAGRSVFAYTEDLDQWLAGGAIAHLAAARETDTRSTSRSLRWLPAVAAAILLAAALTPWWRRDAAAIATATLVGEHIVAADAGGRELWRYALPHIDGNIVPARLLVTDIDGDDRRELLAAVHFMKRAGDGYGAVMAFEGNGRLRWQRSLMDRYEFGAEVFAPAWFPEDILVYRSRGSTRIAVAQHHHTWWPGVVVTYDANGQALDRFVNAGWIRGLNISADGRHLLAAGISNSFGGAALAVLDAARPGGTSPAGGSLPVCSNCPAGNPVAYFVAPWSDLARPSDTPNAVIQVDREGGIQWRAIQRVERDGKDPEVIIGLSPTFALVRQDENGYFTELRAALSRPGVRSPAVREWTGARGWVNLR
jgi:hypothetical protein